MANMTAGGNDGPVPDESAEGGDELLAGYALNILDADERERASASIASFPELREAAAADEEIVGLLGEAVPRHHPPPALRRRVMDTTTTSSAAQKPTPIRRFRNTYAYAAVAAALLVVALAVSNVVLLDEVLDRGDEVEDRDNQIALMKEVAATIGAGVDWEEPLVFQDMRVTVDTTYQPVAARQDVAYRGLLFYTEDGSAGWIVVVEMQLKNDQVYQAWLEDEEGLESAGTFVTDDNGRGFLPLIGDDLIHTYAAIHLTIEPPGGSEQPTTPIVLTGSVH